MLRDIPRHAWNSFRENVPSYIIYVSRDINSINRDCVNGYIRTTLFNLRALEFKGMHRQQLNKHGMSEPVSSRCSRVVG